MGNINIRRRIETISNELEAVVHHAKLYGGIAEKDARFIDNVSTSIAEVAAHLAAQAREVQKNRSHVGLVRRVRKALGFTVP